MEQIPLENLSDVELKALAYDHLVQLDICQRNLQLLNQELSKRNKSVALNSPMISQPILPVQSELNTINFPAGSIRPI